MLHPFLAHKCDRVVFFPPYYPPYEYGTYSPTDHNANAISSKERGEGGVRDASMSQTIGMFLFLFFYSIFFCSYSIFSCKEWKCDDDRWPPHQIFFNYLFALFLLINLLNYRLKPLCGAYQKQQFGGVMMTGILQQWAHSNR